MALKILIVEDEFVSRTKLQKILSILGEVHHACNGKEAEQAFLLAHDEGTPYHLITVDINLPDTSGTEVVRHIRSYEKANDIHKTGEDVKILMVTAHSGKNVMDSFKEGCEGYIVKPFDSMKISRVLHQIGIKLIS